VIACKAKDVNNPKAPARAAS